MPKTYSTSNDHDASPEKVLATLTDPEFLVEREKAQGAIDATVQEIRRSEKELVLRLDATEYGRTMTGGLDKSKQEKSSTVYEWNLETMKGEWTYEGTHGKRIQVSGSFRVTPREEGGARVFSDFHVKVDIPLLGGKIEKMVIKEIEKSTPVSAAVLRRFLAA